MTGTPKDKWVDLDGLRLHYRDWAGAGAPLVLVHGLASTCRIWDLVAPILAQHFRVIALDQRGHGESDKPDSGYDFATVCGDLQQFIKALGMEIPLLVGHSWGGSVALEYAYANPSAVRGLCLIDGGTNEVSNSPGMTIERAREEMAPPDFTGMKLDDLRETTRQRDWGFELTPEIERIMLSIFEDLPDGTLRARFQRSSHLQVIDALWEHKPSAMYSRIECPVLLMPTRGRGGHPGKEWQSRKQESIALAEQLLPTSRTVWLEDSVHDVPLQRPELVARVIANHAHDGFFGG